MRKILVIDDEKPTLSMFRLFLGAYGYMVLTAENGKEGLELFMKEKPPIVLTDIKMPGMDGFEVLKRIKTADASAEVIVITGHGDMDLAIKALDFGATDFIKKPIQKAALDAALIRAEERLKIAKEKEEGRISLRTLDDVTIMEIKGNVTSSSEPVLWENYEKALGRGVNKIIMHFDDNCAVSGAGIAVLIQILSKSKQRNQAVAITGLSENFKKIFDMVGITNLAEIFDSEEDAMNSLIGKG
jgi:anti-anti-sigma factor